LGTLRAAIHGYQGEVPETVLATVQSRLSRLEPEARRALRAAGHRASRGTILRPALAHSQLESLRGNRDLTHE
jgi:hypothetical protein